jgi:hypothetical protein
VFNFFLFFRVVAAVPTAVIERLLSALNFFLNLTKEVLKSRTFPVEIFIECFYISRTASLLATTFYSDKSPRFCCGKNIFASICA